MRNNGSKRRNQRREKAKENVEARAKRSAKDQIAILDERLGAGVGAHKERARLQTLIEAQEAEKRRRAQKPKKDSGENNKNLS